VPAFASQPRALHRSRAHRIATARIASQPRASQRNRAHCKQPARGCRASGFRAGCPAGGFRAGCPAGGSRGMATWASNRSTTQPRASQRNRARRNPRAPYTTRADRPAGWFRAGPPGGPVPRGTARRPGSAGSGCRRGRRTAARRSRAHRSATARDATRAHRTQRARDRSRPSAQVPRFPIVPLSDLEKGCTQLRLVGSVERAEPVGGIQGAVVGGQ